ncbi:MAG TPA: hypothetical protein VG318_15320 [Actinomycetota bacterium]|nr:hypothetical protein [Actinomycetota bacterium]
MATKAGDLKAKILLAALECSGGDLDKTFTMEDLLVAAWGLDRVAFGLRGFENEHPDSDRLTRELDSRGKDQKGLVDQGLVTKVRARVYRLTVKGLQRASAMTPDDVGAREKVDRNLEESVRAVLDHDVFRSWIQDHARPKSFREAGHFWGVAPGTPPRVIRERVERIDHVVRAAVEELDSRDLQELADGRGRVAFDRQDLDRVQEFQETLKSRFADDLRLLNAYVS